MANNDIKMLRQAILDYLAWVKSGEQYRGNPSNIRYREILIDFLFFAIHKEIPWKEMFTLDTLKAFQIDSAYKGVCRAIKVFSEYLHCQGRIDQPIEFPKPQPQIPLPDLYEHYLLYIHQILHVSSGYPRQITRVLILFHRYLERAKIELPDLNIEHLDAFMATFKVSENTRRVYRYQLRGFLKYLYHERGIIKKDLAPLLVGPRHFAKQKPPKFLRPEEVQKLFASLQLSSPVEIRTYAIVHLAYFLGLRPVEISRITLDDISFSKGVLTLRKRKAHNPITLPVPENVLKAIAAYVLKARPKSPDRHLFLSHHFPYGPMSSGSVVCYLCRIMKKAGLPASGYWLRHTYAQNLLETGRSFYEVKEMLGHDNIESTKIYLHIHTQLMRRVLFNETF
jgi:site-specific recombinase XerD